MPFYFWEEDFNIFFSMPYSLHGLVYGSNFVTKHCCKRFFSFRTSLLAKYQQMFHAWPLHHAVEEDIGATTVWKKVGGWTSVLVQHGGSCYNNLEYHLTCHPSGFPACQGAEWHRQSQRPISSDTSASAQEWLQRQNPKFLEEERLWPDNTWRGVDLSLKTAWSLDRG